MIYDNKVKCNIEIVRIMTFLRFSYLHLLIFLTSWIVSSRSSKTGHLFFEPYWTSCTHWVSKSVFWLFSPSWNSTLISWSCSCWLSSFLWRHLWWNKLHAQLGSWSATQAAQVFIDVWFWHRLMFIATIYKKYWMSVIFFITTAW